MRRRWIFRHCSLHSPSASQPAAQLQVRRHAGRLGLFLTVLAGMVVLEACGPAPAPGGDSPEVSPAQSPAAESQQTPTGEVLDFLLASAAADFHAHGPAGPLRFREVRAGHVVSASGEVSYRLCGQFQAAQQGDRAEWMEFATIRTSGYEQYVGAQAASWCEGPGFVGDGESDLSASLENRLDSQRSAAAAKPPAQ